MSSFLLTGDDTEPKFTINPNTGFIETTNNELNREVKDTYELTVVATDDGNPQRPVGQVVLSLNPVYIIYPQALL